MVNKFSSGEFNTTLIPTDSKHTCSFMFRDIFVQNVNTPHKDIDFKTPDLRIGDQYEIIKNYALFEQYFGLKFQILKGFDGKCYFLKNDAFFSYLKNNSIDYNQLDLDLVTSSSEFMKLIPEEACNFQQAISNNSIKTFTLKENVFIYKNDEIIYLSDNNNFFDIEENSCNVSTEVGLPYNHKEHSAINEVLNSLNNKHNLIENQIKDKSSSLKDEENEL